MKVQEVMTLNVQTVAPFTPLREAAGFMKHMNVGMLPVIDNGRIVGIVTDRDMVVRGLADTVDLDTATVRRVMSPSAVTISAEAPIADAVELMCMEKVGRLVVQNWRGEVTGILTAGDVAAVENGMYAQRLAHVLGLDHRMHHAAVVGMVSA